MLRSNRLRFGNSVTDGSRFLRRIGAARGARSGVSGQRTEGMEAGAGTAQSRFPNDVCARKDMSLRRINCVRLALSACLRCRCGFFASFSSGRYRSLVFSLLSIFRRFCRVCPCRSLPNHFRMSVFSFPFFCYCGCIGKPVSFDLYVLISIG